jgi:hypothetical protein
MSLYMLLLLFVCRGQQSLHKRSCRVHSPWSSILTWKTRDYRSGRPSVRSLYAAALLSYQQRCHIGCVCSSGLLFILSMLSSGRAGLMHVELHSSVLQQTLYSWFPLKNTSWNNRGDSSYVISTWKTLETHKVAGENPGQLLDLFFFTLNVYKGRHTHVLISRREREEQGRLCWSSR